MKPEKTTKLFHISPIKNKKSILKNGLKASQGLIFFYTNRKQEENIAFNQIFSEHYSIFEIDPKGIDGKLQKDNVAEMGSCYQVFIEQSAIEAKFIKHIGDKNHNVYDFAEKQNIQKAKLFGLNPIQYLETIIRLNPKWVKHYNKKYGKNLVAGDFGSLLQEQASLDN